MEIVQVIDEILWLAKWAIWKIGGRRCIPSYGFEMSMVE